MQGTVTHRGAHRRDSIVFTVVVTGLTAVGGVVVAGLLAMLEAPGEVATAALLAALPVGPLIGCFLWLDRYEPEPRTLLLAGFGWGAVVSVAFALLVQLNSGSTSLFVQLAVVAPLSEEAAKGLFLVLLLWWRRAELDGVLDGIVYAGMIGVGFAFTENILYLSGASLQAQELGLSASEALTGTFVVRCLASPFAHPLFSAFVGVGVGVAVASRSRIVQVLAVGLGYACAVFVHGVWNASTLMGDGTGFFLVYLVAMAPLFVLSIGLVTWLRGSEKRLLAAALGDAARRGLLPVSDIAWLIDLRARREARRHARNIGGTPALRAMEEYQQAAVELGFLHHRYLRGTPPPDFAARGQSFVVRLGAVRPLISFPGQVVPTR